MSGGISPGIGVGVPLGFTRGAGGTAEPLGPGIWAMLDRGQLVFKEGASTVPSAFARASQAWDGKRLVPLNWMRLVGATSDTPAVLIEGQRTNLLAHSSAMTNWNTFNANVSSAGDHFKLTEKTTSAATHSVGMSFTASGGTAYSTSFYAKAGERPGVLLAMSNYGRWVNGNAHVKFDLVNGIIIDSGSSVHSSITPVGDGWFRCEGTFVTTAGADFGTATAVLMADSSYNTSYPGDGTSSIYIKQPQTEIGQRPSSYIPTDGSPATRAGDTLTALPASRTVSSLTMHVAAKITGQDATFSDILNAQPAGIVIETTSNVNAMSVVLPGAPSVSVAAVADAWNAYSVTADGNDYKVFRNGSLVGVRTQPGSVTIDELKFQENAFKVLYEAVTPGAQRLGIPLLDFRAWSETEIADAHAAWLAELNQIVVPA